MDLFCQAISRLPGITGNPPGCKVIVFCNQKDSVDPIVEALRSHNFTASPFSADYSQAFRQEALRRFKQEGSDTNILVCTQILGRGHDFPESMKYVINFDMPERIVEYVHRIGRTGRAGKKGFSLTILTQDDLWMAKQLVDLLEESKDGGQKIPNWLWDESSKRKMRLHRQRRWELKSGRTMAAIEDLSPEARWAGRGYGKRYDFLKQCQERGAARPVTE
eukprot:gnl/TRDRNA2_/TRDRNA2_147196_c0_seq1.p1 gnl/TRDRNA2_/TRDRNA2_147196_c0~~gnl/TRDRNA2_/TRDRNA2_147196_c0_seq1.p1  ORF type:complete len:220 (+),score=32.04 gnl/TRDRNA2_/TRDRNA2_147196_c0_seq1:3-662(+)